MMKEKVFTISLILLIGGIITGCAKKGEKKVVILPPKIPIEKPEIYVPERYEYKSFKSRDPFIPLVVSSEKKPAVAGVKAVNLSQINISDLELSGIIWDKKESMAILHDGNKFGYILKGGRLFADNFKPIKDITGKIIGNKEVFLQQGKTNINFSLTKPKITRIEGVQMVAQERPIMGQEGIE